LQQLTGRLPDAKKSFERATTIQEELTHEHAENEEFRRDLSLSCIAFGRLLKATGDSAGALDVWRKADLQLESLSRPTPYDLYNLACVRAISSELSSTYSPSDTRHGADQQQRLGDRAMDALGRGISAGFNNISQIEKDTDLDSLRSRSDFQTLLSEMRSK
jgi:hypothetical protein